MGFGPDPKLQFIMDSLLARGCCSEKELKNQNDNKEKIDSYFNPCCKLDAYNWLRELAINFDIPDVVEVRFKNTRKGYYRNVNGLRLKRGDIIAVESSPGHDIGIITLAGEIVHKQVLKTRHEVEIAELKKVYRKAKPADIDKWREAIELEKNTMLQSRKMAEKLNLDMKIGDVEYQGDKTKAIFYYIADERVDFRELIKVLAETFRIRIEMRQIGARQEAGKIGGIGTCGREICCSTFITNFVSVTTQAARIQEVSLNPQKLAGQCGKLKCCLNYELQGYTEAQKNIPNKEIVLKTSKGEAFFQKNDVYRGIMWYAYNQEKIHTIVPVPIERVKEVMKLNREGKFPDDLITFQVDTDSSTDYKNDVGQDSLTRFEKKKPAAKKNHRRSSNKRKRNN